MKLVYTTIVIALFSLSIASPAFSASIDVPFTSQAPEADWSQPWQDACEETTIAMVDYFYTGNTFNTVKAKGEILKILDIKEKYIGESLDENAEAIVYLINHFLPWEAYVKENPSVEDIKTQIDQNRPVIMPVHGKYLYNPHFKNGGPEYHTLVISGYDDANRMFITQEPGTRWGLDFRYSYDTILNAMHDYLPGLNTKNGAKIAIFTQPNIEISANHDGDNDGLSKIMEMEQNTILWTADSDNDGYSDGMEVDMGYSPISESIIRKTLPGTLIKSPESPMVYLFYNGIKRHILNEIVFVRYGWQWFDIFTVPNSFVDSIQTGEIISQ